MNRKAAALIFVAVSWTLSSCHRMAAYIDTNAKYAIAGRQYSLMLSSVASADSLAHYIAERDTLEIVTPESDLQKSWESAVAYCGTIRCEVVTSSIIVRTASSFPAGSITLRVAAEDMKKLLDELGKLGKISQHSTEREDKTTAVIDTEAKLKNLTAFRDNLRTMLAKPSAKVSDLVDIQKQLADTQAELDSETAQRKILANETEKIAVQISFRIEATGGGRGGFSQIWESLLQSGVVLGESTASLITTIVAIIPWLVLIIPGSWLLAKGWRKWKRHRKQGVAPQMPAA